MGWLDDLANKVGISSKSLGINTAEDKAAREAEAIAEAKRQEEEAANQRILESMNQNMGKQVADQQIRGIVPEEQGMLSQAYEKALNMAKGGIHSAGLGIGDILGNKDLTNLAGAGLAYGLTSKNRNAAEAAQNEATNLAKQVSYLKDPSVAQIQDDAANKAYLAQATKGLADRAAMGLTPQDLADLEKIRNQQNQTFQAQQNQISENMARRGMGNSGLALAQQMGASQQAGQQAAQNATDLSSQMFQAKQNALGNLANTASSALSNQFNRDYTRAGATDQVNQFNTNLSNQSTAAQRQQALNNVQFQQQTGQNKAKSIGDLTQAGSTYLNSAFGKKPTTNK